MTVEENIALPLELAGKKSATEVRKHVAEILERVQINAKDQVLSVSIVWWRNAANSDCSRFDSFSRIDFSGRATGNLDTENGTIILEMLQQINADDKLTIIMATHSLEAAAYSRRNIALKDGRMI